MEQSAPQAEVAVVPPGGYWKAGNVLYPVRWWPLCPVPDAVFVVKEKG